MKLKWNLKLCNRVRRRRSRCTFGWMRYVHQSNEHHLISTCCLSFIEKRRDGGCALECLPIMEFINLIVTWRLLHSTHLSMSLLFLGCGNWHTHSTRCLMRLRKEVYLILFYFYLSNCDCDREVWRRQICTRTFRAALCLFVFDMITWKAQTSSVGEGTKCPAKYLPTVNTRISALRACVFDAPKNKNNVVEMQSDRRRPSSSVGISSEIALNKLMCKSHRIYSAQNDFDTYFRPLVVRARAWNVWTESGRQMCNLFASPPIEITR